MKRQQLSPDWMATFAVIGILGGILLLVAVSAAICSVVDQIDKSACRDSGGHVFSVEGHRKEWRCVHPDPSRWPAQP